MVFFGLYKEIYWPIPTWDTSSLCFCMFPNKRNNDVGNAGRAAVIYDYKDEDMMMDMVVNLPQIQRRLQT